MDGDAPAIRAPKAVRPKRRLKLNVAKPVTIESSGLKVPGNLRETGEMHFPNGNILQVHADDLIELSTLGRGTYGYVTLNKHVQSDLKFAVKHIKQQDDINERKAMMKDLEVNRDAKNCPHTVEFYGALFREGEVLICMEVMEVSLYEYYKQAHSRKLGMPQDILGAISFAVLSAIKFLHTTLKIMHRDVKPSNILMARRDGQIAIKMCDFGIAGNLINSLAKTSIGCKPYMSPERIETNSEQPGYNVKSDIWSLGISLIELANGVHPYGGANAFKLLKMVVTDPSPGLDQDERYPQCLADFVNRCLKKQPNERANYTELLDHEFLRRDRDQSSILSHYDLVMGSMTK